MPKKQSFATAVCLLVSILLPRMASAQAAAPESAAPPVNPPTDAGSPALSPSPSPAPAVPAAPAEPSAEPSTEERVRAIEEQNRRLRDDLDRVVAAQAETNARVEEAKRSRGPRVFGYLDFGLFYASGNGSGIRSDDNSTTSTSPSTAIAASRVSGCSTATLCRR